VQDRTWNCRRGVALRPAGNSLGKMIGDRRRQPRLSEDQHFVAAHQPLARWCSSDQPIRFPRRGSGPSAPTDACVPPRTRAGSTWVMACVAVLVLMALIIFVAQNSGAVEVSLLTLHGRFSLAVALLAAAAAGCVLALILGTTRILQLRRVVRRRRREDLAAAPPGVTYPRTRHLGRPF
jgi:uncharacterized integral membrane protein